MAEKFSKRDHEKYVASNLIKSLNLPYEEKASQVPFYSADLKSVGASFCVVPYLRGKVW